MTDARPFDPLAPVPKPPDPALAAEEDRLWNEVLAAFDQETRHNDYLGFCLRNNLLVPCSKRYGGVAADQARPLEHRRVARLHQQRVAKILFLVPDSVHAAPAEKPSKVELFGVFAGVMAVLIGFGWALSDPKHAAFGLIVGFLALLAVGYYLYRKIKAAGEKFDKTSKEA